MVIGYRILTLLSNPTLLDRIQIFIVYFFEPSIFYKNTPSYNITIRFTRRFICEHHCL